MSTISTDTHNPAEMTAIERCTSEQSSNPDSLPPAPQAPFDSLATEIVETIFKYACPEVKLPARFESHENISSYRMDSRNYLDPMALAMVSRRWRAITVVHHSLWATVVIYPSSIGLNDWNRWGFRQLEDRLERSGACPLKIVCYGRDEDDEAILGILNKIMLRSMRWKNIKFSFLLKHKFFEKLASIQGRLPLLEYLDINLPSGLSHNTTPWTSDSIKCCAPFLFAPLFKTVHVGAEWGTHMDSLRNIKLPWTQISDLTCDFSGPEMKTELHEMLLWLSTSLTNLTFAHRFSFDDDGDIPSSIEPIVFPKLRRLCLAHNGTDMLDMLICPTLEHLDFNNGNDLKLTSFLDNSSCTLTHIRSGNTYKFSEILRHASLSMLQSLHLHQLTETIVDLLVFDSRKNFPCLETLCLDLELMVFYDSPQHVTPHFERLQRILDSRTGGSSMDHKKSSSSPFQRNSGQQDAISSFKNYSISLHLPKFHELEPNYAEIPLQKLKLRCAEWDIRLNLKFWYSEFPPFVPVGYKYGPDFPF